jgi:lipid-A-disaccharide synthase-like uncharacterized protein
MSANETNVRQSLNAIPYMATSVALLGRFILMYLLYKNKSTSSLSLLFCSLTMMSSGMWIYYSVQMNDRPMVMRSGTEMTLPFISALYIIRNKVLQYQQQQHQHMKMSV